MDRWLVDALDRAYRTISPIEKTLVRRCSPGEVPHFASPRMPDFMLIGAPQSGTTWLHERLTSDANGWTPRKEVGFFDRLYERRPLRWYGALFRDCPAGRLAGDMSTNYARITPARIADVHRLSPDIRLLMVARDPVDRAWASIRRNVDSAVLSGPDAYAAARSHLDAMLQPRKGESTVPGLEHSAYGSQLMNWFEVFDPAQLLFVTYEQLFGDPIAQLGKIVGHLRLSLDGNSPIDGAKLNANPQIEMPAAVEELLVQRYAGVGQEVGSLLGVDEADLGWRQ